MMRVGVLGAACASTEKYIGHLRAIPGVELVGIADTDVERGTKTASQSGLTFFPEPDALLSQALDGAIICAEVGQRCALVERAAEQARHILCEIPMGQTTEDVRAAIETCQTRGAVLQPAFVLRFAPVFKSIKQWLNEGKLGRILGAKATYQATIPAHPVTGVPVGGVPLYRAPHVIDLLRWLWDTEVTEVYAEMGRSLLHPDMDIDDVGLLSMSLENGAYATVDLSWSLPKSYPTPENLKIEILGDAGSIRVDAFRQNIELYHDGAIWVNWGSDPTRELIREFVGCIAEASLPSATGYDALCAQLVVEAAYRSAATGIPVTSK